METKTPEGEFSFNRIDPPKPWLGRYGRIPGDQTVFHIRWHDSGGWWPMIEWERNWEKESCWALDGEGVGDLVDAGNDAKRSL